MTRAEVPADAYVTVVGEDELQRLTVTRFPPGPESDAFFASLDPSVYLNNLLTIVVDARTILQAITGSLPEEPPDPNSFAAFTDGWYAATCWGYADAIMLREDAPVEFKLAWSQMLGAMMTEWDWRLHYKKHIVRGAKTQKAASAGGKQRNRALAPKIAKLLTFMNNLIPEHSIKYAAEQAHKNGLGASVAANLKTWDRKKDLLKGVSGQYRPMS